MADSVGLNRQGGALLDWRHCLQSIQDILSTPIGTRVMRRDYGSEVPDLIDRPSSVSSVADTTYAMANALQKWEPRFRLYRVAIAEAAADGHMVIDFEGIYFPRGHFGDYTISENRRGEVRIIR